MHRSTIQTRKRLDRMPGRRQLALCGYVVIPAFRARAHTWLTWVAFLIAERAAGRIDDATVENIQAAVDDLAYEVERGELPLSYESVDQDERDDSVGGAAHAIDQTPRRHVVDLGQSLRRMGLRPGPHFPEDSLVSRFTGDDGFTRLLTDWDQGCRWRRGERPPAVATGVSGPAPRSARVRPGRRVHGVSLTSARASQRLLFACGEQSPHRTHPWEGKKMVRRLMFVAMAGAVLLSASSIPQSAAPTAVPQGKSIDWCC
jgi:hypothetical protein